MNDKSESIRPLWELVLGLFGIYCAIQDEPSPLLELPAELQNHIWELAFTPTQTDATLTLPGQYVELQHAARFKADLLVVSRKIYEDAVGFSKSARGQYWRDTAFVLNYTTSMSDGRTRAHLSALDAVNEAALKTIQHLKIQASTISQGRPNRPYVLEFEGGIWRRTYAPRGQMGSCEEYAVLVSKDVMKVIRERRHIPIRCPAGFERAKNEPPALPCL